MIDYAPGTIVVKVEHEHGNTVRGPIDSVLETHLNAGWKLTEAFVEPDTERDAAMIDGLADEWHAENKGTAPRMYRWLREKARQKREEAKR